MKQINFFQQEAQNNKDKTKDKKLAKVISSFSLYELLIVSKS